MAQLVSRRAYIDELSSIAQEQGRDLVAFTNRKNQLDYEVFDHLPLHHSKGQAFAVVYGKPEHYVIDGETYEITHELIGVDSVD